MSRADWWTDEEDAQLMAFRRQGMFMEHIADAMGRSLRGIKERIKVLRKNGVVVDRLVRRAGRAMPIGLKSYEISTREYDIRACDELLKLLRQHHPEHELKSAA